MKTRFKAIASVMAVAATMLALAFLPVTDRASACSVSIGSTAHRFGGIYKQFNWTGDRRAVKADLGDYTPSPVFDATAWFVMLEYDESHYIQTGTLVSAFDPYEYIFAEWNDGGNYSRRFYNTSDGQWYSTPQSSPSSQANYEATWNNLGSGQYQAQMSYNGGSAQTGSVTFVPDIYIVATEQFNYAYDFPTKNGDHLTGDASHKVHADSIKYYDTSGWHDAHTIGAGSWLNDGTADMDITDVTGVGFRVWDNRCPND